MSPVHCLCAYLCVCVSACVYVRVCRQEYDYEYFKSTFNMAKPEKAWWGICAYSSANDPRRFQQSFFIF